MTKMSGGDLELAITRVPQESSHSSVPCQWGWMMAGIKFSSTCQISQGEHMEQTILKPWESR